MVDEGRSMRRVDEGGEREGGLAVVAEAVAQAVGEAVSDHLGSADGADFPLPARLETSRAAGLALRGEGVSSARQNEADIVAARARDMKRREEEADRWMLSVELGGNGE